MTTEITTHVADAKEKLLQQYKNKTKIEALIAAFATQIQEIETAAFDVRNNRSLNSASGNQLDRIGAVLNEARQGSADSEYRIRLFAKIGQNTSAGTPEALISIYQLLMQATSVQYIEHYPATVSLTAMGVTPVANISAIVASMDKAKSAGVSLVLSTVSSTPFVFDGDPDPAGLGFGLDGDPSVGGNLAIIL